MEKNNGPVQEPINLAEDEIDIINADKIDELKTAAKKFLETIRNFLKLKETEEIELNKYLKLFRKPVTRATDLLTQIYNNEKISQNISRYKINKIKTANKAIDACFEFQDAINKFLNINEIIMTWITPDGKVYHLNLEYEKELLKTRAFDINTAKVNLPNITQRLIDEGKEKGKIKEYDVTQTEHQQKIYNLYQTMDNNQKRNNEENQINNTPAFYESEYEKEEGKVRKKSDLFFVMKLEKLTFKYVNNWGVLREAYYAALMDKKEKFNDDDQNKQANILYEEYIQKVDNLGGALGGDVSVINKDKTKTEYAVKTNAAKSQSFAQYLTIAQKIANMKPDENFTSRKDFNTKMQTDIFIINGEINDDIKEHLNAELQQMNIQGAVIT